MFQACVSISACIFYVFMNIYTGYVCINGHTAGGRKKITDLHVHVPTLFISSPLRQYNNNNNKIGLSLWLKNFWGYLEVKGIV